MKRLQYDVVIIGAGVAGLYCALHLPKDLSVLILCKGEPWECNTFYAQGGITIARDKQDIESHVFDTMQAGSNLNKRERVEFLSKQSLEILEELKNLQFPFDTDELGALHFTKEGGHALARIVHAGGDGMGRVLHTFLMAHLPHTLWKHARVLDLLIERDRVHGVCVETKRGIVNIYSNYVVIASGGVGALFKNHTNAFTSSADLHGVILEHGFSLENMEMLQFHPSVFIDTNEPQKPLISESVRGEGGKIIDSKGRRFLFEYDKRGELAPRDIVSRAIVDYCLKHDEKAFLDLSAFDKVSFEMRFPNIYRTLSAYKLDIPKQLVQISPAFHYCMGGIMSDENALVHGVKNLYAIGECASSGVHGANRLASNSLLEGLVYGKQAAKNILENPISNARLHFPLIDEVLEREGDEALHNLLSQIMWEKVGVIRTRDGLNSALGGIEVMLNFNIGRLLRLHLLVAQDIVTQALSRTQSLGAHYII